MFFQKYFGQHNPPEDKLIRDRYFPKLKNGYAIDVGAIDGISFSTTYYFEKYRNWTVLSIEANPEMHEALKQNRKYPVHTAISSYIGESEFYIFDRNDGVSANACSALEPDERLVADHVSYIAGQRKVTVPVETLDSCLEKYAELFPRIDYVNIDVEGTELDVLKGFSIDKWDVQLFVVENNYEDPECRDYLKAFGYKLDWRKYKNDYFVK